MLLKPSLSNDGLPHYMKMWPKMRMYNKGTGGRCTLNDDQVGVQRILPLDYSTMHLPPLVGICQENVEACSQIAVFTPQQPHSGSLEKWKGQLSSCLVMSKNTASWDLSVSLLEEPRARLPSQVATPPLRHPPHGYGEQIHRTAP